MKNRLLLVEDSISFAYWLKSKLEDSDDIEIILARSLAEAKHAISKYGNNFFLALLDLTLPDAYGDDIVNLATKNKIPCLVFTGTYSDELGERMFSLGAIDYVIKDNPHSLNYLISLVRRLIRNKRWYALVVDDSQTSRMQVSSLLKKYQFNVLEASGAEEALKILSKNKDIRLVITDYNMPSIDGHELTRTIRHKYSPERLAIIGISGRDDSHLSSKFLKLGANDFINKPFRREEFFCRITQNMNYIESFDTMLDVALREKLQGLSDIKQFFDISNSLTRRAVQDQVEYTIGILEVDEFDSLLEAHGQEVGETVIKNVASIVESAFFSENDIVARFAKAQFAIFMHGAPHDGALQKLEHLCAAVSEAPLRLRDDVIPLTVSIGSSTTRTTPLEDLMTQAAGACAAAAQSGGNQVVFYDEGDQRYYTFFEQDPAAPATAS